MMLSHQAWHSSSFKILSRHFRAIGSSFPAHSRSCSNTSYQWPLNLVLTNGSIPPTPAFWIWPARCQLWEDFTEELTNCSYASTVLCSHFHYRIWLGCNGFSAHAPPTPEWKLLRAWDTAWHKTTNNVTSIWKNKWMSVPISSKHPISLDMLQYNIWSTISSSMVKLTPGQWFAARWAWAEVWAEEEELGSRQWRAGKGRLTKSWACRTEKYDPDPACAHGNP